MMVSLEAASDISHTQIHSFFLTEFLAACEEGGDNLLGREDDPVLEMPERLWQLVEGIPNRNLGEPLLQEGKALLEVLNEKFLEGTQEGNCYHYIGQGRTVADNIAPGQNLLF